VYILGLDLAKNSVEIKRRIGVVPEGLALFERLTGAQLLNFVGRMYGLDRAKAAERSAELLEFMDLKDSADITGGGLLSRHEEEDRVGCRSHPWP